MADLFYYRLIRRSQEINSEVICADCMARAHEMLPLSASEKLAGYEQRTTPYFGEKACMTCGAERDRQPICIADGCTREAGQLAHPYYPELCRACGDKRMMAEGEAAARKQGAA